MFANLHINWQDDVAWQRQLGWLKGKFPSEIIESKSELSRDDRPAAWSDLWSSLASGGSENTGSERELAHKRLIIEADKRYSDSSGGSATARGRAWIQYGCPDNIRQFSDEISRESRWEIWIYHDRGLTLSFYDAHGLGDFRLFNTELN